MSRSVFAILVISLSLLWCSTVSFAALVWDGNVYCTGDISDRTHQLFSSPELYDVAKKTIYQEIQKAIADRRLDLNVGNDVTGIESRQFKVVEGDYVLMPVITMDRKVLQYFESIDMSGIRLYIGIDFMVCAIDSTDGKLKLVSAIPFFFVNNDAIKVAGSYLSDEQLKEQIAGLLRPSIKEYVIPRLAKLDLTDADIKAADDNNYQVSRVSLSAKRVADNYSREEQEGLGKFIAQAYTAVFAEKGNILPPVDALEYSDAGKNAFAIRVNVPGVVGKEITVPRGKFALNLDLTGLNDKVIKGNELNRFELYKVWLEVSASDVSYKKEVDFVRQEEIVYGEKYRKSDIYFVAIIDLANKLARQTQPDLSRMAGG